MIPFQNFKVVNVTPGVASVNNASAVTTTIDTLGFDYCTVLVEFGVMDAALTALKVQESDYANMSGGADVTGLVSATSSNIAGSTSTLPVSTNDNTVYRFDIDLKGRKRYLDLIATVGAAGTTGAFISAQALLSRAENFVDTAAGAGCLEILRA